MFLYTQELKYNDFIILNEFETKWGKESLLYIRKKSCYNYFVVKNLKAEVIHNEETNEKDIIFTFEMGEGFNNLIDAIKHQYIYEINDRYNLTNGQYALKNIQKKKRVNKKEVNYLKDLEYFLYELLK